ncbi:MAG: thiamine diphosphokinase [Balneolaceae bacterium]
MQTKPDSPVHPIPFHRQPFDAVLLCDGSPPPRTMLEDATNACRMFIAADGGGNRAREMKLMPDAVIGDLDSFTPETGDTMEVIHDPCQETNDLEKALQYAHQQNAQSVLVFGATGLRFDHALKNLSVMARFHSRFKQLVFRDAHSDLFLIDSPYETDIEPGLDVSLFPLSGRVEEITTGGLQYPLRGEPLENGVRDGSSNRTTGSHLSIHYRKGDLLLIINHKPATF